MSANLINSSHQLQSLKSLWNWTTRRAVALTTVVSTLWAWASLMRVFSRIRCRPLHSDRVTLTNWIIKPSYLPVSKNWLMRAWVVVIIHHGPSMMLFTRECREALRALLREMIRQENRRICQYSIKLMKIQNVSSRWRLASMKLMQRRNGAIWLHTNEPKSSKLSYAYKERTVKARKNPSRRSKILVHASASAWLSLDPTLTSRKQRRCSVRLTSHFQVQASALTRRRSATLVLSSNKWSSCERRIQSEMRKSFPRRKKTIYSIMGLIVPKMTPNSSDWRNRRCSKSFKRSENRKKSWWRRTLTNSQPMAQHSLSILRKVFFITDIRTRASIVWQW